MHQSLGHSRRFGAGVMAIHEADNNDMEQVYSIYSEKRQLQAEHSQSLQAIDNYTATLKAKNASTNFYSSASNPNVPPRRLHQYEQLSHTTTKIGSSPAPYRNPRTNKWTSWDAGEYQRENERNEIWKQLTDTNNLGSTTLSSLHFGDPKNEKLNPITHQPIAANGGGDTTNNKYNNNLYSHSSYNTNKHGNRNSPQTLVERARSLERSLSVPSFVPSKVQVLKPFTLSEFHDTDNFINQRTLRQNIDLPISPVRRLNALYSPVKHQSNDLERGRDGRNLYQEYQTGFKNTTTKQQSNFSGTGLLDMNEMQRIQYVNALKHEQKISFNVLYKDDVLRISNLYLLPTHLVLTAIRNATSISSNSNGQVDINVFIRRLLGVVETNEMSPLQQAAAKKTLQRTQSFPETLLIGNNSSNNSFNNSFNNTFNNTSNTSNTSNASNTSNTFTLVRGTKTLPKYTKKMWKTPTSPTSLMSPKTSQKQMTKSMPWQKSPRLSHSYNKEEAMHYLSPLKTTGTQTNMHGGYATNYHEMQNIVENHEMKKSVNEKVRALLKEQQTMKKKARKSRTRLKQQIAKDGKQQAREQNNRNSNSNRGTYDKYDDYVSDLNYRAGGNGHGNGNDNGVGITDFNGEARGGGANGGVGRSSGGGTSDQMKGIFGGMGQSRKIEENVLLSNYVDLSEESDISNGFDSLATKKNPFPLSVLEPEEELLTFALQDSMEEVKKCRLALGIANHVVTELRQKNEILVQQSFRRKMGITKKEEERIVEVEEERIVEEERRVAPDGNGPYTYSEFYEFYQRDDEWKAADPKYKAISVPSNEYFEVVTDTPHDTSISIVN